MRLYIGLCYGTAEFAHAIFLEIEVATTVGTERIEHRRIDSNSRPFVQCSTEVFSHFEDHLVILIDSLNTSGVLFTPLHLGSTVFLPGFRQGRYRCKAGILIS